MEIDKNLREVDLSMLMEEEEEMTCDIRLYEEQLLNLQLSLQKKKITNEEYQNDYNIISAKSTSLRESMKNISIEINSRIKDYDEYSDEIDYWRTEDFIDDYEKYELL